MKLHEIISLFEQAFPSALQEKYDNSGLIIGNPDSIISKILICVDINTKVVDEAIFNECNLIVSHHPFIFNGIKNILTYEPGGQIIEKAIKNNISIFSLHTNFDNSEGGMNSALASKLNLQNCRFLKPKKGLLKKLVTFCPANHAEKVRNALFEAGAGHIGNYSSCSYNNEGTGTFKALENANPYCGSINQLHFEPETRIETIFPVYIERNLIKALLKNHPYEEVAYDIYPLDNPFSKSGDGVIGELNKALTQKEFLSYVKKTFEVPFIKHTKCKKEIIKNVALCGGSGSFLIHDAVTNGADAFITADIKYHQFFDTPDDLLLIDAGHYETEQFSREIIHDLLIKKIPTFAVRISEINTNPVNYF